MTSSQSWWGEHEGTDPSEPTLRSFEPQPIKIPEDSPFEPLLTRRIHILGLGSIGTFVAHSLRCLPSPPPISLLLHKASMYDDWKQKNRIIRLINKPQNINDEQTGYDIDVLEIDADTGTPHWKFLRDRATPKPRDELMESGEIYIHCLIVAVKANTTSAALRLVKHRVNAETTICFLQNGMGQIEELNREVFTDPETRPTYLQGVISHGVHLTTLFAANHAGFGTTAVGIVRDVDKFPLPPKTPLAAADLLEEERKRMYPSDKDLYASISARYLVRTLTRSPALACAPFPHLDLFQLQLEKLAINSLLNPITAVLDIPNGSLLYNTYLTKVHRLLLAEISMVFRGLPELEGVPGVRMRFSPDRLEALFMGVTAKTAENSSSMREDVRRGRPTEVEYINGYVVKRGEEQGIKCVLNYMLMELMLGKSWSQRSASGEVLPYGVSRLEGRLAEGRIGKESGVMLEDTGTPARGQKV